MSGLVNHIWRRCETGNARDGSTQQEILRVSPSLALLINMWHTDRDRGNNPLFRPDRYLGIAEWGIITDSTIRAHKKRTRT